MMQFNLLPYRARQRHRRRLHFCAALLLAMLLGAAAAGIGWHAVHVRRQMQSMRNDALRQAAIRLEKDIAQGANLQSKTGAVLADIEKIESWQRRRNRGADVLATLAAHIPPDAYLRKMQQQDGKVTLDGVAGSNRTVTALLQNLSAQTTSIASAQLLETRAENRRDGGSLAFGIVLTLR
ncbi:hypothetical protein D9O50_12590 [Oxalobacteraceae bacterium CAVE-383]|nr:hypothetical protein D9O50_12590 [Oxalobacteraceae bacterium CAVE-383]